MPSLSLPVQAPVDTGFPTRRFDAGDGHFGIDLAVSEGTMVRAVGAGYVVLADWTQEGGYTVVVQHSDGYLSVYKHNKRLLKQIGDRVQAREALAVSGNSGQMTTGPHLHFELWRNGLAQDPRPYVTGW
jgi:murein DD-endopeptidase MepM/ murein hydrolase activator NlpD